MKMLRYTFMVLALAAVFGAAGVSASAGATKAPSMSTGYQLVATYGPTCTTKPKKVCGMNPIKGATAELLQGTTVVVRAVTNAAGVAKLPLAAPNGKPYTLYVVGKIRGRRFKKHTSLPAPRTGLMMPYVLTVSV